jgi:hypothetical protein
MIRAMMNEFLNSMYYLLPTLSRLMAAAERDTRPESYDGKRVEILMELVEQVISKFAQIQEGEGLRNTEAACALLMVAGFIADTQIVDHEATRKNTEKLHERILGDVLANFIGTGKPN